MTSLISYTFQETKYLKEEAIWKELSKVTIRQAMKRWLMPLSKHTASSYKMALGLFEKMGLLSLDMDLQQFASLNHNAMFVTIRDHFHGASTKRARSAALVSFINYLNAVTDGVIKKFNTKQFGKPFSAVRKKAKTKPMAPEDWQKMIDYTEQEGLLRERLILIFLLQGGKRIGEVLRLNVEDVDFNNWRITFHQSKSKFQDQTTVISFPAHVFADIKAYIRETTKGPFFLSKTKKRLTYMGAYWAMRKISQAVGVNFHTHQLRASCITYLRSNGYQDSQIQKITGHCDLRLIDYYDKSTLWDNPSKGLDLSKDYVSDDN